MNRDKARDDKFFSCQPEHEINYVVNLYAGKTEVNFFLQELCKAGIIKYLTHHTLYKLIEKDLGFPVPN